MNQMWLKKIRVVVSLIFLVLTTLLFVDFERFGPPLAQVVRYPQFVPSLLNFTQTLAWIATGFLAVLALTFLFGRVYCSMICPLSQTGSGRSCIGTFPARREQRTARYLWHSAAHTISR